MVGLSFLATLQQNSDFDSDSFFSILKSKLFRQDVRNDTIWHSSTHALASVKYDNYPIESFENESFCICLEGRIYGLTESATKGKLFQLAHSITLPASQPKKKLTDFIKATDGEFLIFIKDKNSGNVFIFNDIFSRLPVFYCLDDSRIVLSRDIHVVTSFSGKQFDRLGIAQYLSVGYYLGDRTYCQKVKRMNPASFFKLDIDNCSISYDTLYSFDFGSKDNAKNSISKNASQLADLFVDSCSKRYQPDANNVISLSGGLDSRTVCAGLNKLSKPFMATVYLGADKKAKGDSIVSKQLADALEVKWKLYNLEKVGPVSMREVLRLKPGLVPINKYSSYYYNLLRDDLGTNINFFNGNGGDKMLPALKITTALKVVDNPSLAKYILKNQRALTADTVTALIGITEDVLIDELVSILDSYPEKNMSDRYAHYSVCQRSIRMLFEGNDFQRDYFWSTSPFWDPEFFSYAMNCPRSQKNHGLLYARMLERLNPLCLRVPYKKNHIEIPVSISADKYKAAQIYKQIVHITTAVANKIGIKKSAKLVKLPEIDQDVRKSVLQQIDNCAEIGQIFSADILVQLMNSSEIWGNSEAIARLTTLTSLIEHVMADQN